MTQRQVRVCIGVNPAADTDIFRIGAADDVLRLLVDAHEEEFTIPELVEATGVARSTVWRAVDLLDDLGVLRIRETVQRNYVSIDPEALEKDDPILAVEQPEFQAPIRAFIKRIKEKISDADEVDRLVGVVLFGSVARGEADRQSDIDLFVVVEGDRTSARRRAADVVSELGSARFDGDRYEFEQYVESVASASRAGEKLREIFEEGITVYEQAGFQEVRRTVLADE